MCVLIPRVSLEMVGAVVPLHCFHFFLNYVQSKVLNMCADVNAMLAENHVVSCANHNTIPSVILTTFILGYAMLVAVQGDGE